MSQGPFSGARAGYYTLLQASNSRGGYLIFGCTGMMIKQGWVFEDQWVGLGEQNVPERVGFEEKNVP